MLKKISNGCVHIVQRYLPDPFIFCILLTIVVFIAAIPAAGATPLQVVGFWGTSIWSLLAFSMQMALVLVLGTAMATAPPVKRLLDKIAGVAKTPFSAIVLVTVVGTVASWLNWGFGLVVGALLAKAIAKKVKGVDYRLLIASAYSGFVVWHAGLSGSIPLTITEVTEAVTAATGGALTESIGMDRTVLSPWNLIACLIILILMPLLNAKMHPAADEVVTVDPKLLVEEEVTVRKASTPAEKLEDCKPLSWLVVIIGVVYLVQYFAAAGNPLNALNLNIVNLIFLLLGVLLNGTPLNYVKAVNDAVKGAGGIVLQFPFYAGIQGMMVTVGSNGVSLASAISTAFVNISTPRTFPVLCYLAAGIVNFFVPSGGGQWAVQGPIMMPAGLELGVTPAVTAMGIAWGDAWTNMLQPFWALPALGIAGLGARDIMGYCAIVLIASGIVTALGFLFLVPLLA